MGVQGEKDKMASFNGQTKWIQEGLRKTGEIVFPRCVKRFSRLQPPVTRADSPAVDLRQVRHQALAGGERTNERAVRVGHPGRSAAGRRPRAQGERASSTECGAEVRFFLPKSPHCFVLTSLPSALDRTQNVLPSWHLFSTVSGQQTALGIAHAAQAESSQAAAQAAADGQDAQRLADEHHQQCAYPFSPPVHDGVLRLTSALRLQHWKSTITLDWHRTALNRSRRRSLHPRLRRSNDRGVRVRLWVWRIRKARGRKSKAAWRRLRRMRECRRVVRSSLVSCWRRTSRLFNVLN